MRPFKTISLTFKWIAVTVIIILIMSAFEVGTSLRSFKEVVDEKDGAVQYHDRVAELEKEFYVIRGMESDLLRDLTDETFTKADVMIQNLRRKLNALKDHQAGQGLPWAPLAHGLMEYEETLDALAETARWRRDHHLVIDVAFGRMVETLIDENLVDIRELGGIIALHSRQELFLDDPSLQTESDVSAFLDAIERATERAPQGLARRVFATYKNLFWEQFHAFTKSRAIQARLDSTALDLSLGFESIQRGALEQSMIRTNAVREAMFRLSWGMAFSAVVGLLFVLTGLWLLARRIIMPLRMLSQVASEVASGQMNARIRMETFGPRTVRPQQGPPEPPGFSGPFRTATPTDIVGPPSPFAVEPAVASPPATLDVQPEPAGLDELGELAQTFNRMLDALEEKNIRLTDYQQELKDKICELAASERELRQHRSRLNALVEERTRELETEKNQLRKVLETAGAAIYVVDRTGTLMNVNDEFTALVGWSRQEAIGQPSSMLGEECPDISMLHVEQNQGPVFKQQCVVRAKDGRRLTILRNSDRLLNEAGALVGAIASFVDVTALSEAKTRAEEANRLKSEFLANMSHEIRTPMNALLGMSQLLEMSKLDEEQRKHVRLIRTAGESLLVILNDILDFSKIEAGRLDVAFNAVNLPALADEMRAVIGAQAEKKGLAFSVTLAPDAPAIFRTDPVRLRQVLANLLSNAVKFTDKGRIDLRVRVLKPSIAETDGLVFAGNLPVRATLPMARFEVSDTGVGVPFESRELIFDPFVQADGSNSRGYGGTGLGLAISNKLVRLLGGDRIRLESEPGKGSVFFFDLPILGAVREASQTAAADLAVPQDPDRFKRMEILAAEDNPMNRYLLRKVLENLGVGVIDLANDGQEVVEKAIERDTPYDLILMDIQMPVVDGYEASKKLREHGIQTPIAALTAHALDRDKDRCVEAGMAWRLAKPYKVEEIRELLDEALRVADPAPTCSKPGTPESGGAQDAAFSENLPAAAEPRTKLTTDE